MMQLNLSTDTVPNSRMPGTRSGGVRIRCWVELAQRFPCTPWHVVLEQFGLKFADPQIDLAVPMLTIVLADIADERSGLEGSAVQP